MLYLVKSECEVEESTQIGVLDTSVIIDLDRLDSKSLPPVVAVPTIALAELAAGVHATDDPVVRAERMNRLHKVSLQFEPLPFDEAASQQYGTMVAHVIAAGRNPRPRRMDLLIAATAGSHRLPLYTRNPNDFIGLEKAVSVIAV